MYAKALMGKRACPHLLKKENRIGMSEYIKYMGVHKFASLAGTLGSKKKNQRQLLVEDYINKS